MKKHYAVRWQDGKVVSIEVNGVSYADASEIADESDRAAILRLMSRPPREDGDLFDEAEFDREFTRLHRETAHMPRIIVGIFLAVALIMLVVTVITGISTAQVLRREQSVPAWVADVIARTDDNGQVLYYPVVEFTLHDGTTYSVIMPEGSATPAYHKGQEIDVRYDPQHPTSARIPSRSSTLFMWLVPLITGLLALAFLGATGMSIWLLWPELTARA